MKFASQETAKVKLDLFENKLVYAYNEAFEANVKLPLKVTLVSEATSYISNDQCYADHTPTTLGYYWINDNKCLRTAKGLVFKRVKKEQSIQTQLNTNNNTLIYQNIDWKNSVKPVGEKEYRFDKISQINGLLNKTSDNTWYLEIRGRKFILLKDGLEFSYEYDSETGFELINNSISYYNRPLTNVDLDSFKVLNCNYAIDKSTAFCGNEALLNADIGTFKVLTHSLAKDKNQVYYFSSVLKYADSESLQLFEDPTNIFYRDKNYIFQGEYILIGADVGTFKTKGEIFGVDKNHVYRFSEQLQYVDASTFEIINKTYFKDKNNIYCSLFAGLSEVKVCKSDPSFKDLTNGYYKLKNNIYYFNDDGQSVRISNNNKNFTMLSCGWAKDNTILFLNGEKVYHGNTSSVKILSESYAFVNKKIFWRNEEIENADPSTFIIDVCDFAMDKDHIYHAGKQIEGSNPSSFKQLDAFFFTDKSNVYLISEYDAYYFLNIKNIDTSKIEILQSGFFKTNKAIYCDEKQITGADPLTFELIQGGFSHDKNSVYYLEKKLSGLNPQKLNILNHQFIRDEEFVYYYDVKLNLNAKNCVLISDDFIKDKKKVYYKETLIKKADAESFEIINHWFQKDKYRLFHQTTPLELNPNTVKVNDIYAFDEHYIYFSDHKIEGVDIASFEVLSNNFSRDKFHVYYMEKILKEVDAPSFQIMSYSAFKDKNNVYTFKQGEFIIDENGNS